MKKLFFVNSILLCSSFSSPFLVNSCSQSNNNDSSNDNENLQHQYLL